MKLQIHMTLTTTHVDGSITVVCRCGEWRQTFPSGTFVEEARKAGDEHLAVANRDALSV